MTPDEARPLPLSMVTLIFGALSVPLSFARHLVSLALVLAVLSIAFGWWGRHRIKGLGLQYTSDSVRRNNWGSRAGLIGLATSIAMWILWRTNVLLT